MRSALCCGKTNNWVCSPSSRIRRQKRRQQVPLCLPCPHYPLKPWLRSEEFRSPNLLNCIKTGIPLTETPSVVDFPTIPEDRRCGDPPLCYHARPARQFTCKRYNVNNKHCTVTKRESANQGRIFYTCGWPDGKRCSFFRWQDENHQYSEIILRNPLSLEVVLQETTAVKPEIQKSAWAGTQQGSEEWHRLRACHTEMESIQYIKMLAKVACVPFERFHPVIGLLLVTLDRFIVIIVSVRRAICCDLFCGLPILTAVRCVICGIIPSLLFLSLPNQSTNTKNGSSIGSVNEKVALRRFSEFITQFAPEADLPVFIDEPGIWLCSERPYLAGSPDGVIYETLGMNSEGAYQCRRSLIEIKPDASSQKKKGGRGSNSTPYKLRQREENGEFYPLTKQSNGRRTHIPASYYDQSHRCVYVSDEYT